jgi:hypothetical protein
MSRFLLACAVGLLALCISVDFAVAQGTCQSQPRPEYISGSPPPPRSPLAIRADRTDNAHCVLTTNNCAAGYFPTVTETAPSCTCECKQ